MILWLVKIGMQSHSLCSERALVIHNPMRYQMDPWLRGINFDSDPRALCDESIACVRLITLHTTRTKDFTAVQHVSTVA